MKRNQALKFEKQTLENHHAKITVEIEQSKSKSQTTRRPAAG